MAKMINLRLTTLALAIVSGGVAAWWSWSNPTPDSHLGVPGRALSSPVKQSISAPRAPTRAPSAAKEGAAATSPCTDCAKPSDNTAFETAAERADFYQKYADQLREQSAAELAQQWLEIANRNDPDELPVFMAIFAQSLRESGDARLYQDLSETLQNPGASEQLKAAVLNLLGQTATPQAMQILTDSLANGLLTEDNLIAKLRENIHEATATLVNGNWNWNLSPVLEKAWRERDLLISEKDRALVAQDIAYLSTAEGARTLLETLRATTGVSDADRNIAATALASLERIDALPALTEVLADPKSNPELTTLVLATLVNVGASDAYIVLTQHFGTAQLNQEQQTVLRDLLMKQTFPYDVQVVLKDAIEHQAFAQESLKTLLDDALKNSQSKPRLTAETAQ